MNKLEKLEVAIAALPHDCAEIKRVAENLLGGGRLNSLSTYMMGVRDGFNMTMPSSPSVDIVRNIIDILL